MQLTNAIPTLTRNDRRLITRDPFLIVLSLYVLFIGALARFGLPRLTDWLLAAIGFNLADYYALIASLLILFPQFVGIVFGFLLLDERDQRTMDAMLVTPLLLRTLLAYRVLAAVLLSFAMAVATVLIYNPASLTMVQALVICLSSAVFSAVFMLFLASTAANKVEGFALAKIYGLIGLVPLVAYFIPQPWQFLFGLFPPYWTCKAVWMVETGGSKWLLYAIFGGITGLLYIWGLARLFIRVTYR